MINVVNDKTKKCPIERVKKCEHVEDCHKWINSSRRFPDKRFLNPNPYLNYIDECTFEIDKKGKIGKGSVVYKTKYGHYSFIEREYVFD